MKNKEVKALLISVIVPIYNVEKYLHKCIDSLIGQTLKDIEIILVDDGSIDCLGLQRYKELLKPQNVFPILTQN